MSDGPHLSTAVSERWHRAPAYLLSAFLLYVAVLTFLPDLSMHFGGGRTMPDATPGNPGGWAWLYRDPDGSIDPARAHWWGAAFALMGLAKIASVELHTVRARGYVLVPIMMTFVWIARRNYVSSDHVTPGTGIYILAALFAAWWLYHAFVFDRPAGPGSMGA